MSATAEQQRQRRQFAYAEGRCTRCCHKTRKVKPGYRCCAVCIAEVSSEVKLIVNMHPDDRDRFKRFCKAHDMTMREATLRAINAYYHSTGWNAEDLL